MEFPRAREHAITAIDIYQSQPNSNGCSELAPTRMIELANVYDVKKWLEPAYEALAERVEVITEEEAEVIGGRGMLVIMKARETRREGIRHMRVALMNDVGHTTEGKALQGDETRASDVDSRESYEQDKVLGDVLRKTAAQGTMDYERSVAVFENITDVKENANLCSGLKPVVTPLPLL